MTLRTPFPGRSAFAQKNRLYLNVKGGMENVYHAARSVFLLPSSRKEEIEQLMFFIRLNKPNPMKLRRSGLSLFIVICLLLAALPAFAASVNTATVYFTLSSNGVPVIGEDGTVLSRIKVTVPYFDIGLYGLEDFYRCGNDGWGEYTDNEVVERPTVLHLYLYMLEKYYMGLPDSQCCRGNLDMSLQQMTYDRAGNPVFEPPVSALQITGSSTSMYMYNFWGHDENLMYFVDHQYPLMSAGWGSTADYILLEDGMDIDVAMFSNWDFYHHGSFMYFDKDEYRLAADARQTITVLKSNTGGSVNGEYEKGLPAEGVTISLWDEDMTEPLETFGETDAKGHVTISWSDPGTYKLSAEDPNQGTNEAAHAPAYATVVIADTSVPLAGLSFSEPVFNLEFGNTRQLVPVTQPANATGVSYSWTSSASDIVGVTDIGVLNAKASGEAVISCTATDGKNSFTASCTVSVAQTVAVTGVTLSDHSLTLKVGDTATLGYTISPANATNKALLWRTSECPSFDLIYIDADHTTAKVDHLGKVTAKKAGEVTIIVRTVDGRFTDRCTITVTDGSGSSGASGDVSGDGKMDVNDAVLVLQYAAGLTTFNQVQLKAADVSGNGRVGSEDAVLILQAAASN